MTANTPATRKAKGRNLQNKVVSLIRELFPSLSERDVVSVPMGVNDVDIRLSEAAFKQFPFAVECKAAESLNIWNALKQAEAESRKGAPLLVFKRNRSEVYCALKLSDFLSLIKGDLGNDNQREG